MGSKRVQSGIIARLIDPPKDYSVKIAMVDLSRKGRRGTIISVAVLTPQNRRRIVEIRRGGWDGEQIAEQIGEVFSSHPDLQVCYIESVSLQKLFVDILKASKEKYSWWSKIGFFEDTTISKGDPQTGIMVMAITYGGGGFELPDVRSMHGHGRKCECGYCIGIYDGTKQGRLAPVESDVLITFWGIHIRMPHTFKPRITLPPTVQSSARSGYDLAKNVPASELAAGILGGQRVRDENSRQSYGAKKQHRDNPAGTFPIASRAPESDDGWGEPRR
jgi:hypothetical protein